MRKMFAFAAIPALLLAGCGDISGKIAGDFGGGMDDGTAVGISPAKLGTFDKLGAFGPDNIVVTEGAEFSIRAEGDADAVAALRYKLEGGTLKIGRKSGNSPDGSVTVHVVAPPLKSVSLAGSGDIAAARLAGDSTELSLAGSGDLKVAKVETQALTANIAGSGTIAVAGGSKSLDVSIAGSGDFDGAGFRAERAEVSIAGSGDAELMSDGEVAGNIMGSGDVTVKGKAKCSVNVVGSGELKCG